MKNIYSIGEFSKISGLPVKTLRFYHEKGLLIPAAIDTSSGYREYDDACVEKARIIMALKRLEFSLEEIGTILESFEDESDLVSHLQSRKKAIASEIKRQQDITRTIDNLIQRENQVRELIGDSDHQVEVKSVPSQWIGGIRMKGRYPDCRPAFGTLGRKLNRHIAGRALTLYYDGEYREEDADFEPAMPVKRSLEVEGISIRELPECECLSLMHRGSYEELGRSYGRLFAALRERDLKIALPTREVYHKGPGMIFKGNPDNYLTEIQFPITAAK